MMRNYRLWTALVLIAALLGGCDRTRDFFNSGSGGGLFNLSGSLDGRYNELKDQPPSPARSAALLQLAGEANQKAGSARTAEDRISFYSRAATYAWAADTEEARGQVIRNADAGFPLCQTLPADRRKPGRDCALLAAYGPVAAGELALTQIDNSKPITATTVIDLDSLKAVDTAAQRFKNVVDQQWPTVESAMTAPAVPAGTVDWFAKSKLRQWCRFYLVLNQAKRWKLDSATRTASRQVRTSIVGHYDAVFADGKDRVGVETVDAAFNQCAPFAQLTRPEVPALEG